MIKKNMGRLDRTVRFVVGVVLVPTGLFALGGWQGNWLGLLLLAFALLPLVTSVTGFCPLYVPFEISTLEAEQEVQVRLS